MAIKDAFQKLSDGYYELLLGTGSDASAKEYAEKCFSLARDRWARNRTHASSQDPELWVASQLAEFGDDHVGGAKFLRDNFDRLSDEGKNRMYESVDSHFDELPKEAQQIIAMLAFRCDAGRKQMIDNLERSAKQLPPGTLRRNLIGE
jgi:hypothetical protein